jgi:hypothetical protein
LRAPIFRVAVIGGAVAALAAGALTAAGAAAADDFIPTVQPDLVLAPGYGWDAAGSSYGIPDGTGTVVYAFSKQPLTDATWKNGGLPSGLTATAGSYGCKVYAAAAGVFTCPVSESLYFADPWVEASTTAAGNTTGYLGVGYAPHGTSLATAVKAAQLAGTTSDPAMPTAGKITVRTPAEVAENTIKLTTPDVPLSSSLTQTAQVHAADTGFFGITFANTQEERGWDEDEVDIEVASVDGGSGADCDHVYDTISAPTYGVYCDLEPGDHTITYTLRSGSRVPAWKIAAEAEFQVWDNGPDNPSATSTFSVVSPYPVRDRYRLFARDTKGNLDYYDGTGKAAGPYSFRQYQDEGWGTYTAITPLSRPTVHSTGDLVARDGSGTLWLYAGSGNGSNLKARVKVGPGWNIYKTLVGAGDLTGDGRADLIARDSSGALWLYRGTGKSGTAAFAARTKIGPGWNIFTSLTSAGDITGDGRADLTARDSAGVLWLYKGTGSASGPFAARTRIGSGWNTYTALAGAGDLTGDGRADLIARDSTGVLWLYQGTGSASGPYKARTKIGPGWNTFNSLI